jgi:hypothetical protein
MEQETFFDLVEIRNRCDMFLSLVPSHPSEALRCLRIATEHVKALQEKQSKVYPPAQRLLNTCMRELPRISPLLPAIVKGWLEGQDEGWFKERCSELDAPVAHALAEAMREAE